MKNGCLAVIPARGGSKRIPRKNIKNFSGKPVIQYSIDAAVQSGCFDEIMVSTDDQEIAEISLKYGAGVPFLRSKENSSDHAGLADVLLEVIENYKKSGVKFNYTCCILPTAPFITPEKILEGYGIISNSHDADSVISIVRFSYPIQRALKIEDTFIKMILPENYSRRSQDLQETYHDSGQFYWIKNDAFIKEKRLITEHTRYVELPDSMVQDIDTEADWEMAEIKYKISKMSEKC